MKTVLALAALVLIAVPVHAFQARVIRCHDGGTCTVDTGRGTLNSRVAEIDAPEIDQPYGAEAQLVICGMICGRVVDVEPRGAEGLLCAEGGD